MPLTAKERIQALKAELDLPNDTEWHYVWVNPTLHDGIKSIQPMTNWCRENKLYYWDFKWVSSKGYHEWLWAPGVAEAYPDKAVCFKFSDPEHATLFKLTWS